MLDDVKVLTPSEDAPFAVMHREMREATERQAKPETLADFAVRVGIAAGEVVPVTRSCFGTFTQEPETNRWVWVGIETPDPAHFDWVNDRRWRR